MSVMFDDPQWVAGQQKTQAEVEVHQVVCLSADGEVLINVLADRLMVLSAGDLPGTFIQAVRVNRPKAYRPWTAEDDARLTELWLAGVPVARLAEEFGRQYHAITARARKLGLPKSKSRSSER